MVLTAVSVVTGRAEVVLPALISDNMVVQRDVKFPVWGWATPGETVRAQFNQQQKETVADRDGRWKLALGPRGAGGPHELVIRGWETVTLTNILVGDVWVCAGQSNMQFPVKNVIDAPQEVAAANLPNLRLFTVPMQIAGRPQEDVLVRSWSVCDSNAVAAVSAVGYFFGRHVQHKLKVPVGLINCSWYGTSIIGWTSRRA
jgi:sialate O-acetylesterase